MRTKINQAFPAHSQFVGVGQRRYCAICKKQIGTERGKFVKHDQPGTQLPCPNSGKAVNG